jgi:hypothetical protein
MLPPRPLICIETVLEIGQALLNRNTAHITSEDDSVKSEDECDVNVDGSFIPAVPSPSHSASPSLSSSITPSNLHPELTCNQQYAKESCAQQQAVMQELHLPEDHHLKSAALKKWVNLEVIPTPTNVEEFNATSTGWVGVWIQTEKENFMQEQVMGPPYNLRHIQ